MKIITLDEVASTNTYVKQHIAELEDDSVVLTHCQTAGRGQRGNSWEAEPGKNLTFSLLLRRPAVKVQEQFRLSEAVALATVETLDAFATGFSIKWPNDIYHNDDKIAGVLIEQSLDGNAIDYSIVGIGLNVNQRRFVSDAPNPVSLWQITGEETALEPLLERLCARIIERCARLSDNELHPAYLKRLWRNDGAPHPYALPDGTAVSARIVDVEPDGHLLLAHAGSSTPCRYAFKEIAALL
ncbi:MAG: biotin--[Muribaculaceae bacterium]|nr:biotin--[acetyl-CoA-carboxylase] ligase [Muribaculaceae bacterium]